MKKKFECEIDCANCAAKIQEAIGKIPGVQSVKLNFMMQKFTLEAEEYKSKAYSTMSRVLKRIIRVSTGKAIV